VTKRTHRYGLRSPNTGPAADAAIFATERAALLEEPCSSDGNRFTHIRVRHDVIMGNARGRSVYERHRAELLTTGKPGRRVRAFYTYDCPFGSPTTFDSHEQEARWLHARGFLTAAERRRLPKEWFAPTPPTLTVIP
jgi:hypothetical protein